MQSPLPAFFRAFSPIIGVLAATTSFASSQPVCAQSQSQSQARALLGRLLSVGGYFLTDSSGKAALGDVKFLGDLTLYARPAHRHGYMLTGGLEYLSAVDHFFPFQGGSEFFLLGPSGRVDYGSERSRLRPYVTGGLFLGSIRSERLGFSRADFTPSLEFGVDWKVHRYITLTTGYRVQKNIAGVNTDGFVLSISIFK